MTTQPAHGSNGSSHDTIIIGAGQAGLALGYFLQRQARQFLIVEAAKVPGAAWLERWESLKLFTPARFSGLPGFAIPGDPDEHPPRDEVASYLRRYARHFELPLATGNAVLELQQREHGYLARTATSAYEARQVVIATGPFQTASVPAWADELASEVHQIHAQQYRTPRDITPGRALVVGGGNTGYQIAEELAASREVHLSVGSRQKPLPQRVLGRDVFWYLDKAGVMRKSVDTRLGQRLQGRDTLIGSSPRTIRKKGVTLHPRAMGAQGATVEFEDGEQLPVDTVVWATGYRPDFSWVKVPVLTPEGAPIHHRGVTDAPGLYFLGLTWMYTRGSALIGWVKDDAQFIADQIDAFDSPASPSMGKPSVARRSQ